MGEIDESRNSPSSYPDLQDVMKDYKISEFIDEPILLIVVIVKFNLKGPLLPFLGLLNSAWC